MRKRRPIERMINIELTSMVDVVFLLIIFFMTTAQFVRLTREKLDLPLEQGEREQEPEEAGLVINLTAEGGIVVNAETLTLADLEYVVREEIDRLADPSRFKLLIRADRNARTELLNTIVSRLQTMGVGAARLATEVP